MKRNKTGKRSILLRMFIAFFCVILLVMIVWAVVAVKLSRVHVINTSKDSSMEAYKLVCDMYEENPNVRALTDDQKIDEESFGIIRRQLRKVCSAFGMDYMYLYRPLEGTDSGRKYYVTVAGNENEDGKVVMLEKGYILDKGISIFETENYAMKGQLPDTQNQYSNEYGSEYAWFYPVFKEDGSVGVLLGMDFQADFMNSAIFRILLFLLIPIVILLLIVMFAQLYVVKKIVINPLGVVAEDMSHFVKDSSKPQVSLAETLNPKGEIYAITSAYDQMRSDIITYLSDIRELTAEKTKQEALNRITEQIHKGILPAEKSLQGDGFDAQAFAESAKSVGGDFYDCFTRDDGSVCAVMGDVSGKGIAAALFMAMIKTMIREHLKVGSSPADVLNYVNDDVCETNPEGMFATVFAMVLDTKTGTMTYANAGHTPPVIYDDKKNARFLEVDTGMALGLFPDAGIINSSAMLTDSQGVLLYTDGVTEAVNADDQFFGEDRLLSIFTDETSEAGRSAVSAARDVMSAVKTFEGELQPFDDITLLSVRYSKL